MMNVFKESAGDTIKIVLHGSLDGSVDLFKLIGPLQSRAEINCKGISYVNSAGVSPWMNYFQKALQWHVQIRFVECSPVIIEYFNLMFNFACGGKVMSVWAPFLCGSCKAVSMYLVETLDLKSIKAQIEPRPCQKCAKPGATFDDMPAEFFRFMSN